MNLEKKINLIIGATVSAVLFLGFWIIISIESKNIERRVKDDTNAVTNIVRENTERILGDQNIAKYGLQELINGMAKSTPEMTSIPNLARIDIFDINRKLIATTESKDIPEDVVENIQKVLDKRQTVYEQKELDDYYKLRLYSPIFDAEANMVAVAGVEVITSSKKEQNTSMVKRQLLELISPAVQRNISPIVLSIESSPGNIQKIVDDSVKFSFVQDFVVFDKELNVLAGSKKSTTKLNYNNDGHAQDRRDIILGLKSEATYENTYEDRVPVVVRLLPIKIRNTEGMEVAGIIEGHIKKSAFVDDVHALEIRARVMVAVLIVVLVIILAYVLRQEVVAPLKRYSKAAKKVAEGDLTQKVEVLSGSGEVGQFGAIFNSMVNNLREVDHLKSNFISVAAHQMRTPLSSVKWAIKALVNKDFGPLNDTQLELLNNGYSATEKMVNIVNDLLSASMIEDRRFEYILEKNNILTEVNTVLQDLRPIAESRDVELIFVNHIGEIPLFVFDKEKIFIVLQNILDNAIKYSRKGGKVTLEFSSTGDSIEIKVTDTGVGIPEDQKGQLFSKFFRAKNVVLLETEGSGLGLFIVKSIIEHHGGTITIRSEEDKGTTVVVTIPLTTTEALENEYEKAQ